MATLNTNTTMRMTTTYSLGRMYGAVSPQIPAGGASPVSTLAVMKR